MDWLTLSRGTAPLIIAFPHGGTELAGLDDAFISPWLARHDSDWWIAQLYEFAGELGATSITTAISRSVIDCNRDPSGVSLYPGLATTGLCPAETFAGVPLYSTGDGPDEMEIARRRERWFAPYHAALVAEIARLRARHDRIVVYDAHSIRSHVPRLFAGILPQFNIGTHGGNSCDPALEAMVAQVCANSSLGHVVNGRFKGGWSTRHYGQPARGVHAIQMELGMRGYMAEPDHTSPANWPSPLSAAPAILPILRQVIDACLAFAKAAA